MKANISVKIVVLFLILAASFIINSHVMAANGDWDQKTITPSTINNFNGITYGNGKYVAISTQWSGTGPYTFTAKVYTSTDLATWTLQNGGAPLVSFGGMGSQGTNGANVQFWNGIFVAWTNTSSLGGGTADSGIYTSLDGITWARKYTGTDRMMNVIYTSNQFITTHISGTFDNVSSTAFTFKIRTSVDTNVWTERFTTSWTEPGAVGNYGLNAGATFWNNTFVAWMNVTNTNNAPSTTTNKLLFSSDGITWAERYEFGNGALTVARLRGTWVAGLATNNGGVSASTTLKILSSSDEGYTWTERYNQTFAIGATLSLTTNNEDALVGFIFVNNTSAGQYRVMTLYSSDGVAWSTNYDQSFTGTSANWWTGYANPYFVMRFWVNNAGTYTMKILFAPNGYDWAESYSIASATATYGLAVLNRNNNFLAFGNDGAGHGMVWKYTPAFTVWTSGAVRDSNGNPVSGANVFLVGTPSINTTTNADGRYKLTGIPSGTPYTIKVAKVGYWDSYYVPAPVPPAAPDFTVNVPITGTLYLYTNAQVAGWGATTDKGAILTRAIDGLGVNTGSIGGVVATATGQAKSYPVSYMDEAGNFGGTSTYPIGRIFVLNADAGDSVTLNGVKAGWNFIPDTRTVYANGVTLGNFSGVPMTVTGPTPSPAYPISGLVRDLAPPSVPLVFSYVIIKERRTLGPVVSEVEVSRPRTNEYGYYFVDLISAGDYSVTAVKNGYESMSQPTVVTLSEGSPNSTVNFFLAAMESAPFPLAQGWNFISFPKVPTPPDIATIMANVADVRIIWGFDNPSQMWKKWTPTGGLNNTLSSFEVGKGYWVFMNASGSISTNGWTSPLSTTVHLNEGWNLTGYLGTDGVLATTELNIINGKWAIAWNWTGNIWYGKHSSITTLPAPIGALTNFNQGKAYWVKIKTGQATDWTQ